MTGDLGYMVLEPFAERLPDRFFNVGVAEQNMVGVATGLAETGFVPFVYSIATFAALRPYEFIRNGPCSTTCPCASSAWAAASSTAPAGHSHHGLEDVGVMRLLPALTIVAPADHPQARTAIRACGTSPVPSLPATRQGRQDDVPGLDGRFDSAVPRSPAKGATS